MKTIIVNVPDKKEELFLSLMRELKLKTFDMSSEELEDKILARWIEEGMKTDDVPLEKVFEHFRKHVIKA